MRKWYLFTTYAIVVFFWDGLRLSRHRREARERLRLCRVQMLSRLRRKDAMKTLTAILLLLLVSPAWGARAPERAVGTVGDKCSFVVVSPDGVSLTAEHCQITKGMSVSLNGKTYTVEAVFDAEKQGKDEAVILDISGSDHDYAPVARSVPQTGDKAWSIGYPGMSRSSASGEITSVCQKGCHIWTNFNLAGGHSGGPLFNEQGQVVGLASGQSHGGASWIGWTSIVERLAQAGVKPASKVAHPQTDTVYALCTRDCAPCEILEQCVRDGKFGTIGVTIVIKGTPQYDAVVSRMDRAGARWNGLHPTLWVAGSGEAITYDVRYHEGCLQRIARLMFGGRDPNDPGPSPQDSLGEPSPLPIEDMGLQSEVAEVRGYVRGEIDEVRELIRTIRDDDIPKLAKIDDVLALKGKVQEYVAKAEEILARIRELEGSEEVANVKSEVMGLLLEIRRIRNEQDTLPFRVKSEVEAVVASAPDIAASVRALEDRLQGKIDSSSDRTKADLADRMTQTIEGLNIPADSGAGKILGMGQNTFGIVTAIIGLLTGTGLGRVTSGFRLVRAGAGVVRRRRDDGEPVGNL